MAAWPATATGSTRASMQAHSGQQRCEHHNRHAGPKLHDGYPLLPVSLLHLVKHFHSSTGGVWESPLAKAARGGAAIRPNSRRPGHSPRGVPNESSVHNGNGRFDSPNRLGGCAGSHIAALGATSISLPDCRTPGSYRTRARKRSSSGGIWLFLSKGHNRVHAHCPSGRNEGSQ